MQLKVIDKPVQEVTNSVRELLGTVTRSEEKESDPGPDLVHSTTLDNASDADPAPYPDETANLYPRATKTDSSIIALKAKESKSQ